MWEDINFKYVLSASFIRQDESSSPPGVFVEKKHCLSLLVKENLNEYFLLLESIFDRLKSLANSFGSLIQLWVPRQSKYHFRSQKAHY